MTATWQLLRSSLRARVDLHMVLCGGQCFRWTRTPRQTYIGVVQRRAYELREVQTTTTKTTTTTATTTTATTRRARQRVHEPPLSPCVIEYRRLYPPPSPAQPQATTTAAAAAASSPLAVRRTVNVTRGKRTQRNTQQQHSSNTTQHNNKDDDDDDEAFLTHYLALDVDVPALWRAWTCDNAQLRHPLVQHLLAQPRRDAAHERDDKATTTKTTTKTTTTTATTTARVAMRACPCIPVRHLRQDVHETLFSFVCSQNNHLTRITQMVASLSRACGVRLCAVNVATGDVRYDACNNNNNSNGDNGEWLTLYSFPTIAQLCGVDVAQLRALGFGYRSAYIRQCALHIAAAATTCATVSTHSSSTMAARVHVPRQHAMCVGEPWYERLLSLSDAHDDDNGDDDRKSKDTDVTTDVAATPSPSCTARRRAALMQLPGVGRKVADCVLLFALGHTDVVPVDTHMAQVAAAFLCDGDDATRRTASSRRHGDATRRDGGVHDARKRRKCDDDDGGGDGDATASRDDAGDWQAVLRAWRERSAALQAKKAQPQEQQQQRAQRRQRDTTRVSTSRKPVLATLSEAHHDAIQAGFRHLFGAHCGLAHTILFYHRALGDSVQ